jgi:hypothetical protein
MCLDCILSLHHHGEVIPSTIYGAELEAHMSWEKPSFLEVNMNSEIGAYQDEFDERKAGEVMQPRAPIEQSSHVPNQAPSRT